MLLHLTLFQYYAVLSKNVDTREYIVVNEIVKLAGQTGLDNINAQDIDEIFQVTTGESPSNDDLKELVEQVDLDDEVSISEDEEQKELSTDFLKKV